MLSFGTVVALNNLLALKAFYTFLFNYGLHEKPSFVERLWLPSLKRWVEKRSFATLHELMKSEDAQKASVALNDVSGDFFAVLYICQNPHMVTEVSTGQQLFILLAQMALDFEKLKKPRVDTGYSNEPR